MSAVSSFLPDRELVETIGAMMATHFTPGEPGASVIVTRDGKPLFRSGYGMANIELGVAIEPHMIFRLGSMAKQFTAVCILVLCEQGKPGLDDEITRFLVPTTPPTDTGSRSSTCSPIPPASGATPTRAASRGGRAPI